ncbi:embryonic polarity protein dorsal [Drosophila albomicans]|uniref:Embryonic polarity protein dorsal n=1 Tax=Drosophila albomicans TaxID=7291 RepID=A0A6P8WCH1_DROAB|nr:embryonic polarity protein dorsal [Drosophila albomicans]XP_034101354.1 embryonic polarity protein dorsal [Drosophila albomicans]
MAENTGNDGNRSPSMDEDESTLDDLQKIFNPVRSSASEPAMSSMMPLPMHVPTSAAFTRIVVEPTNHIIRFRYKCEGRTAGSIPGNNSKPEAKTYPTIEIVNYNGPAHVFVSCVTADPPYRQHPHELVSKDEADKCKAGAYIKRLKPGEQRLELQKVGIQCTKKTEVAEALKKRKEKNIDPFRAGFEHAKDVSSINLSQLRLCYHVVIMDEKTKSNIALEPVVSSPIYGKSNDLTITKMCKCSSKSSGGDEIILLCEKVNRNDIKIRFFETNADDVVVWEAYGIFGNHNVYKQTAIAFKTPSYHNKNIQNCVDVEVQLVRPSDGATSAPRVFTYKPNPGMLTFARLQHKLKRKQELDVFQQILSIDSETTATKYSCSPLDINEDENTVSSDEQQSSGTLNDFEIAVKKLQMRHRIESEANEADATVTDYTDGLDNDNDAEQDGEEEDMGIELEVPQLLPQLADDCTQTSTPMEEILQQPQLQSRPLSNVDKINEWMKSSEFERTDSLTVENGDTPTLSHSTAQTAFTNVSSLTANTTITNQLDDEANGGSRRDTLENAALKELPAGEEPEPEPEPELVSASAQASVDIDENFDETATYTSLQIAYNHPVEMPQKSKAETQASYHATNPFSQLDEAELVVLTNPPAPRIKVNAAQTPATPPSPPLPLPPRTPSPVDCEHRLPPLPPKPRHSQDLSVSEHSVSNSVSLSRSRNGSVSSTRTTPSPIIIMRTPDQSPTKRLPQMLPPSSTGSNSAAASPKKRQGFFSRLFSRRRSRAEDADETHSVNSRATTPTGSREPSVNHFAVGDPNRSSVRSLQPPGLSPQNSVSRGGRPVGRSSSSVSGKRPAHLDADVIHIPLKGGDSENSLLRPESYSTASTLSYGRPLDRKTLSTLQLADIPISDGNMELVAIADRQSIKNLCEGAYGVMLDPSVDLSEAEHFALYTSKSPEPERELDGGGEAVDAGDFLSADEIARRLAEANGLE